MKLSLFKKLEFIIEDFIPEEPIITENVLSDILLRKSVEINAILGDKMEVINNKKALEFLQNKFHRSIVQ